MNRGVVPFVLFFLVTTVLAFAFAAIVVVSDHAGVPTSLRLLIGFIPALCAWLWEARTKRQRERRGFRPAFIGVYVTLFTLGYIVMLIPALVVWYTVFGRPDNV